MNSNIKRIISLGLAAVMSCGLLAGCGIGKASDTVTIIIQRLFIS